MLRIPCDHSYPRYTDRYRNMRQRKIKNLDDKYRAYEDLIVYDPSELKGRWSERSGGRPVYVEIGCGKGKFISEMAAREPERFYAAVEGNLSVMLRALEKVRSLGLSNVVFLPEFAENLTDWFGRGEVSGIYLNFSDPLPKNYWYRRRLTYRRRLRDYFNVLSEYGTVTFKTDNTEFFEWSVQETAAADLRIMELTRDLHAEARSMEDPEEHSAFNIETEYESKFSSQGLTIKRMVIGRKEMNRTEEDEMAITSMAAYNGRTIPEADPLFAATGRAKELTVEYGRENVINGTAGVLKDDNGDLVVLSSVEQVMKSIDRGDWAEYAPIAGTPAFKSAVIKAVCGDYEVKSFIRAVAAPGGTGAIRNIVSNYSCPGDRILTHDWHWTAYQTIAEEQGRRIEYFRMFKPEPGTADSVRNTGEAATKTSGPVSGDPGAAANLQGGGAAHEGLSDNVFDVEDFAYKVGKLLRNQEHLLIILNTPANNPTGYSLSIDDWYSVKTVLDGVDLRKKVTLLIDAAYIDFAGEPEETRAFLRVADNLRSNVLPVIAWSASKTFTMYGSRCAASVCLAHNPAVADEFERLCSYSARASWSNSPRAPQIVIERIYADPYLLAEVDAERAVYRRMLESRGRAFEEAAKGADLAILPYRAGYFITVPFAEPERLCDALAAKKVCLIPFDGAVRVAVASVKESDCRKLPYIIKETIKELQDETA